MTDVVVGAGSSMQRADARAATNVGDRQLFSPIAKKVLDEIDNASAPEKTSDAHGSVVKRALVLGECSSEPVSDVSSHESGLPTEVFDDVAMSGESPVKKVKNNEKVK